LTEDDLVFPEGNGNFVIKEIQAALFPRYRNRADDYDPRNVGHVKANLVKLGSIMHRQIKDSYHAYYHEMPGKIQLDDIPVLAKGSVDSLLDSLGDIREKLKLDAEAAIKGDPAAKGFTEVINYYPGFQAILMYRVANVLYRKNVPYYPRFLTEEVHSRTGIDIHPGATICDYFFIDHGTGVVIGETTKIGSWVRIYQHVTLGALSLSQRKVEELRTTGMQRHPTIEDNVIVYSGATILGGETVIGEGSVIGGNVWLTESVPRNSRVFIEGLPHQKIQTRD
jgi:serine O-acetyltransferase